MPKYNLTYNRILCGIIILIQRVLYIYVYIYKYKYRIFQLWREGGGGLIADFFP